MLAPTRRAEACCTLCLSGLIDFQPRSVAVRDRGIIHAVYFRPYSAPPEGEFTTTHRAPNATPATIEHQPCTFIAHSPTVRASITHRPSIAGNSLHPHTTMADDTRKTVDANALPPKPRAPANIMPGGTAHTAGGEKTTDEGPSYIDAVRSLGPEYYLNFHKRPCVRDSQLQGLAAGFAGGSLAAIIGSTLPQLPYTSRRTNVGANKAFGNSMIELLY